ncbi:MAG: hypothetical protein OQK32_03950 [Gammaproteobacteria bacterium]|nr:hypothetical protein [Gammaproteobacteria bacterium]MCW8923525.1 hypothetical protein [Gammaproteobacteria bacterium]
MADLINIEKDRRIGRLDRRSGEERRGRVRHCSVENDCRNNGPRRELDLIKMVADGKLWWSGF